MNYFKIICSIIMVFCLGFNAQSQTDSGLVSQIKIEPATHNLGKIKEENGVVKVKFTITNISKQPYIMNYSYAGCGCITAKITKEPLMPGKSRDIYVDFDPKRRPGVFNKDVMLISNNKKRADKLNLTGEVIPRDKSLKELFPVKVISGIILSEDILPLGILPQNEKSMGILNYYNNSKSTVTIEARTTGSKEGSVRVSNGKVAPQSSGQIHFTYNLLGGTYYGELKNDIELYVDGKKWDKTIKVNALVVFNFFEMSDEERAKAPRAIVSPRDYEVAGYDKDIVIPILNNGLSNLKILTTIPDSNIGYKIEKEVIKPNEQIELTIHLKRGLNDKKEGSLTFMFNSPDTPLVTINLKIQNKLID